jgi:hypothetical protein
VKFGAPLTHDNIAGLGLLAAEQFDAKSFAFTVAAVIGTTYPFLVCHVFFALLV